MDNLLKLEQPGTLQNQAYERIKTLLISGQLEFDKVYSANHFAEILGVSRTPIREALLQLTTKGFLSLCGGPEPLPVYRPLVQLQSPRENE